MDGLENFIQPRLATKCIITKTDTHSQVQELHFKEMTISTSKPNNIVQLKNGLHFKIKKIYITNDENNDILMHDVQIEGNLIKKKEDIFTYPVKSSFVGMFKIGKPKKTIKHFLCSDIEHKCIVVKTHETKYVVNLIHE